jgi:flagellar hook-length control protein FliK
VTDNRNGNVTMRLNPESLGRVSINLGLENGVLHARFTVESEEAKSALQNNMNHLCDRLLAEGIALGSFDVNVDDRHQGFNNRYAENHEQLTILNALHTQGATRAREAIEANSIIIPAAAPGAPAAQSRVDVVI